MTNEAIKIKLKFNSDCLNQAVYIFSHIIRIVKMKNKHIEIRLYFSYCPQ
jgi:hypothetical protein